MNHNILRTLAICSTLSAIAIALTAFVAPNQFVAKNEFKLRMKEGMLNHLNLTEVLKITMHFPQVENDEVRPSVRTTVYDFTESVEKVNPDGSALVAVTLDSFKTKIVLGQEPKAQTYFEFSSTNKEDLEKRFHDIRTLPRAQFLGQTLRFTVGTDGQIRNFQNLDKFHQVVMGKDYDYDFVHAMLSLSDSSRLGQLFEHGFGALAAAEAPAGAAFEGPYMTTEIPVSRSLSLVSSKRARDGDSVAFHLLLKNAPKKIAYLEGLAADLSLTDFKGSGFGYAVLENGMISRSMIHDSSTMKLQVDIDTVTQEIVRTVSSVRSSIPVLRGANIQLKQTSEHHTKSEPKLPEPDSDATIIDLGTGKVTPQKSSH